MSRLKLHISGSKSISNRFLIMEALGDKNVEVDNLSNSDDSEVMQHILANRDQYSWDVGHAGTAMRFLTAFAAIQKRDIKLCGSERMHQRPIGPLVEALRNLGAQITYLEEEGYPPLLINGQGIKGGVLKIDGQMSSQFISALAMIAPCISEGLHIEIQNELVSRPYLAMTLDMMSEFKVQSVWKDNVIVIPEQSYAIHDYKVESDWSSASYWFSFIALGILPEIELSDYFKSSSQGDSELVNIFEQLGVESHMENGGLVLTNSGECCEFFSYNFHEQPDVAQTVAVCCFILGIPAELTGLETLPIKETNRLMALQVELEKLGAEVNIKNQDTLVLTKRNRDIPNEPIQIATYKDHRMAMSFAPVAFIYPNIEILDRAVVTKSYPNFWQDLAKI